MNGKCLVCEEEINVQIGICDGCFEQGLEVVADQRLIQKQIAMATEQLLLAQEQEEETEEAMDSMERKYWEGYVDALEAIKSLLLESKVGA